MNRCNLDDEISRRYNDTEKIELEKIKSIDGCIKDGAINRTEYNNSQWKVCWILKEAYDDIEDGVPAGGGWGYTSKVIDEWYRTQNISRNKTLSRVGAITYAINHGFCDTEGIDTEAIIQGLNQTYWINLNKTPAYPTSDAQLSQRIAIWKDVCNLQLLDAEPMIIIYGNTWDAIQKYPYEGLKNTEKKYPCKEGRCCSVNLQKTKEGVIEVNAYHPGCKSNMYESHMIQSIKAFLGDSE